MNSDFEKFIQKNRKEFDSETPSEKVWDNIKLPVSKKTARQFSIRDIYKWSAVAAVFFIIITSAYFLLIRNNNNLENNTTKEQIPGKQNDIGIIAPEYDAEFTRFFRFIENRQRELSAASNEHPELYSQFLDDLAALDSSYRVLKSKAAQSPNRDVIIKAMIQNLQLQAELLNRQLMIFNQFNKSKNSDNESSL